MRLVHVWKNGVRLDDFEVHMPGTRPRFVFYRRGRRGAEWSGRRLAARRWRKGVVVADPAPLGAPKPGAPTVSLLTKKICARLRQL
jgi:hypothetical protein